MARRARLVTNILERHGLTEQHGLDRLRVATLNLLDPRLHVVQQIGQVPLRCSPRRLPTFGCVAPVEADFVLTVVRVQQRDGVAVSDSNDAASDDVRAGLCGTD